MFELSLNVKLKRINKVYGYLINKRPFNSCKSNEFSMMKHTKSTWKNNAKKKSKVDFKLSLTDGKISENHDNTMNNCIRYDRIIKGLVLLKF